MSLRDRLFPPLVETCPRCNGKGYDPKELDDLDLPADCNDCLGVGRTLTPAGKAVVEAVDVWAAIVERKVDRRLDARYGPNNPLDPRNC